MRMSLCVITALVAAFAGAACDEKLSDLTGPTRNLQPTFSSIVNDIFNAPDSSGRPACTQCHASSVPPQFRQGLSLEPALAYAQLVGVASRGRPGALRVAPGDPENSYLVHKLEGRQGILGARMPLNGPYLTEGQMLVIKRWIELGARND